MDLNKLNNLASAKKTEAEKQKEKERLEQLKKEKEKKDKIDRIQSMFDGINNFKVIPAIRNISDEQLQEQIEQLISENYDSEKYQLNIHIYFGLIESTYGENIIDEDLAEESLKYNNTEFDEDLTMDEFMKEVFHEGTYDCYQYNYYDLTQYNSEILINNKNISEICDYDFKWVNLRLYNNNDKNIIDKILDNAKTFKSEKVEEEGDYKYEKYYTQFYTGKLPNIQEIEDELKNRLEDFGFKIIDIKNNEQLQTNNDRYAFNFTVIIKNPTKE